MGKLLKAQTTEKAPYLSVICCNYDHHTTTDNIICINCRAIFYILQQGNTGSSHLDISIRDISLLATITSFICKPPSLRSKKRVCFCGGDIQLEMFNAWGHVRSAEKLISMAVTCDRLLVWDVLPRNVSSAKVSTVKDWTWGEKKMVKILGLQALGPCKWAATAQCGLLLISICGDIPMANGGKGKAIKTPSV